MRPSFTQQYSGTWSLKQLVVPGRVCFWKNRLWAYSQAVRDPNQMAWKAGSSLSFLLNFLCNSASSLLMVFPPKTIPRKGIVQQLGTHRTPLAPSWLLWAFRRAYIPWQTLYKSSNRSGRLRNCLYNINSIFRLHGNKTQSERYQTFKYTLFY